MAGSAGEIRIRATNVTKRFESGVEEVVAVSDVSLTATAGEFVCIYGASGSGKSTLLGLLGGLGIADAGQIEVAGNDVGSLDEEGRRSLRLAHVAVVFQDHNLIDEFSAAENVALPLELQGIAADTSADQARSALASVGLTGLEDRRPAALSGGQRQRVGVARALVGGRSVLLADEPSGSLDSTNSSVLFDTFRSVCDRHGLTVVVCTHDEACRAYADSIYEIADGVLTRKAQRPTP